MKVVVSGNHDWIVYLLMFALSAAVHTAAVFVIFVVEPGSSATAAIEGHLGEPQRVSVADALATWRSRLLGREEALKTDLLARIRQIRESPLGSLESGWTRENAAQRIEDAAGRVGTDVRTARLEALSGAPGRLELRVELQSRPEGVLPDLLLLSHLAGLATQRRGGIPADRLVVEVVGEDGAAAGRFELSAGSARDLAGGRMTLRELFDEGLALGAAAAATGGGA
jgi:hypothetical protein